MVMLAIVSLIACKKLDRKDQLSRVFLITCNIILLQLFFETATCIINKRPEPWAGTLSTILHLCLFATAPMLTYFWYRMLSTWVVPEEKISRIRQVALLIPVSVNFIATILSPVYGLIFSIDSSNAYHRGPLFVLSVVIIYSYFIYTFILILIHKKKVVKEELIPLLIVGILPIIGGPMIAELIKKKKQYISVSKLRYNINQNTSLWLSKNRTSFMKKKL